MISLEVVGVPQPKGSPRPVRVGSRVVVSIKTDRGEAWEQAIIAAVRAGRYRPLEGAVSVVLRFVLPTPRRRIRSLPTVRPDLDKLIRAVLDALERSGLIANDAQVCQLAAFKDYAQVPCVQIKAWAITEETP